jgi:hypothetical protein
MEFESDFEHGFAIGATAVTTLIAIIALIY